MLSPSFARDLHRRLPLTAVAVLAVATAACGDRPSPDERPRQDVMRGAPLFRPSQIVSESSTGEAVQWTYHTPVSADSVARWYRARVIEFGWRIAGDTPSGDGGVRLYIERDGPDLWILIRPIPNGTEFSMIGAAPDSAAAAGPDSA
jgi:hypothetical protein